MRINSIPPKEMISKYFHVKGKRVDGAYSQGVDKAELTSESKTFSTALRAAKQAMGTQTTAHLSRLNEITEQVRNGEYRVSGSEVAKKMLGE